MIIKPQTSKSQKRKIFQIATGGSFLVTPLLIATMLFYKNASFNVMVQSAHVLKSIEAEKVRSADITLTFTTYQNHQKILDLQTTYLPNMRYINHSDIITEEQIELL